MSFFFLIQALIEGIHPATSPHIGKTTVDTNDPPFVIAQPNLLYIIRF